MHTTKITWAALCFALLALGPAANSEPSGETDKDILMDPNSEQMTRTAPDTFIVTFGTTAGSFTLQVHREWSPLGADRFFNLASNGFFNDIRFFRVIPNFMIQFGIHGDPDVSEVWREANIQDDPPKQSNKKGTLTFATRGPGTRTTQMFINFGDNARLDGMGFTPFAQITDGMDIVEKLYAGYGGGPDEGGKGPEQGRMQSEGNEYLEANFPKLDYIKSATVTEE